MLENTFCHIKGIGTKTEARLWELGITTWSCWPETVKIPLSRQSRIEIPAIFEESRRALEKNDPHFFCQRLSSSDSWRIFSHFRRTTAYLDIETTGLGEEAEITTIALYDGDKVRTYINGENLEDFITDVMDYTVLVTYNGKSFDIPVLEQHFRQKLPQAQIDLRFVLARLGLKGGLKGCEKQLGISRGELDGVDGSFAIYLWHAYTHTNDERALQTLLAYNVEDTVNLERLLVHAWNMNVAETPFAEQLNMPFPEPPRLIHHPDYACIERIKRAFSI